MVVRIRISEEVYDGHLAGIFVWFCVQLFLHVGLYNNVDVYYWHGAVFWYYVLSLMYAINEDAVDMHSLKYT